MMPAMWPRSSSASALTIGCRVAATHPLTPAPIVMLGGIRASKPERPMVTSSCVAESGRNSTATESGTDADTNAEIACATSAVQPAERGHELPTLSWHVGFGNACMGAAGATSNSF